jgi:hypothetical protein
MLGGCFAMSRPRGILAVAKKLRDRGPSMVGARSILTLWGIVYAGTQSRLCRSVSGTIARRTLQGLGAAVSSTHPLSVPVILRDIEVPRDMHSTHP